VTTATRDIIEQAFEAGRAAAKYEMTELARIHAMHMTSEAFPAGRLMDVTASGTGTHHRGATKAHAAPTAATKEPKAPVAARGGKKASGPRTKGVKEAIVNLITYNYEEGLGGVTVPEIIEKTGFKENSVRATLMGLKKTGVAIQDGKLWGLSAGHSSSGNGNSETDHVNV
jgi:hypothetical protein